VQRATSGPRGAVLVTGAAGGIGSAVVRELAARGRTVVVTARDLARAQAIAAGVGGAPRAFALALDVTDPASWEGAVRAARELCGGVEVLVNNAGVVEPGRAEDLPLESVRRQVDVNLLGVVHGCRAVLADMRARGRGRIVNVASLGGIVPMPHEAVYCAAKYAVRGYSLALREELRGSGVAVSVVSCGSVATAQLAVELESDGAWLSFVDPPLAPAVVARAIAGAAEAGPAEVLVPGASGLLSRALMAWPSAMLALMPLLRRVGTRNMARLRGEGAARLSGGGVAP
jgi:NADP-dependent 3-hydroxy acid dehydrogenase YdfG